MSDEGDKELSKEEETPSQWIPKLKKAPKSRLFTINNHTSFNLMRIDYREDKGNWRRKPPSHIRQKSNAQWGVEGKIGTEGFCSFVIEGLGLDDLITFSWVDNDGPTVSFEIPLELSSAIHVKQSEAKATNNKNQFSDIVFDIAEDLAQVLSLLEKASKTPRPNYGTLRRKQAPLPPQPVVNEGFTSGYLIKKGKVLKNWKKRFFILDGNGCMYYYKDKEVYEKVKAAGKDPKSNSLGSFEVTNRPCGPAASESSKFAFTFQAKWEKKLERMSVIFEDGSVEFDEESMKEYPIVSPSSPTSTTESDSSPIKDIPANAGFSPVKRRSFDSSSDEENEERQKTLFKGLTLKPKEQVEETDLQSLASAAKALNLTPSKTSPGRKPVGSPVGSPSPPVLSPTTPKRPTPTPPPRPHVTSDGSPQPSHHSPPSQDSPTTVPELEEEYASLEEVNLKSRELLRDAFLKLESGQFSESLLNVNKIFSLFADLEEPEIKRREMTICANYKFALLCLIETKRETITKEELAWLTKFLAETALQPNHKIICLRMAVTHNINAGNFNLAGKCLQFMSNSMTEKDQANLQICTNNMFKDKMTYVCPRCKNVNPISSIPCVACNCIVTMCMQSLQLMSTPHFQCVLCESKLSSGVGNIAKKCTICNFGRIIVIN